jgi:hypothetical protein
MVVDNFVVTLNAGDQIVWQASGAGLNGYISGTLMD